MPLKRLLMKGRVDPGSVCGSVCVRRLKCVCAAFIGLSPSAFVRDGAIRVELYNTPGCLSDVLL